MNCSKCGNEVEGHRPSGVTTCHACGERAAQIEIKAKALRVAPDGNKQGYSYQGDAETARRNILQAGKKTESVIPDFTTVVSSNPYLPPSPAPARPSVAKQRRQIGVYYIGPEAYVWWSDLRDPRTKGATRMCKF